MNPFGWYRALMRNPQYRWLVILGSLIYLISPIDLSPDIVPLVGQIDDVIIVTLLFSEVFQRLLGGNSLESSNAGFSGQGDRHASSYGDDHRRTYRSDDPSVKTVDVKAVSVDDSTNGRRKK
jgi:uncharacterized membrane protein YkvA (DUF1232 family)